jgi:hypothetical protein
MSGGISAGTMLAIAGGAVAGMAVSSMMAPDGSQMPGAPPTPEKPPQMGKAPDPAAVRKKVAGSAITGPAAGNSSTFLTGPSGVDDTLLNLGKNTLMGQ